MKPKHSSTHKSTILLFVRAFSASKPKIDRPISFPGEEATSAQKADKQKLPKPQNFCHFGAKKKHAVYAQFGGEKCLQYPIRQLRYE